MKPEPTQPIPIPAEEKSKPLDKAYIRTENVGPDSYGISEGTYPKTEQIPEPEIQTANIPLHYAQQTQPAEYQPPVRFRRGVVQMYDDLLCPCDGFERPPYQMLS